jgi:hypothetical protein
MPLPLFELRLYHAGETGYVAIAENQITSGSWKIVSDGGYDSARFSLAIPSSTGSLSSLAKAGRRIEAWGINAAGDDLVRLWSGKVVTAKRDVTPPYAVQVVCTGEWASASRARVPTPLVFGSRIDLSQVFAAAASASLSSSTSTTYQLDAPATGLTTDSLEDAYEQPLAEATKILAGVGAGQVSFGSDVVGDAPGETIGTAGAWGRKRLFFRPFELSTDPARWTFAIPHPNHRISRRDVEEDATRLVNVLRIRGGALENENKLAAPTQDNTRLDRITRTGTGAGNLLPSLTAGFENGGGDWTYSGGASLKADTDTYGPSDGNGKWFTLLDNLGEKILQRPVVPGGVQVGRTYLFNVRLRQGKNKADGSASTDQVTLRLRFFTAGGVLLTETTTPFTPAGAGVWRDAQVSAAAPATATQIEVEVELTARTPGAGASTLGVVLDNTSLYDGSQIVQRGWFIKQKTPVSGASAVITRQNWQAIGQGGDFGPYALEILGTSSDDYDNDYFIAVGTSPNEELASVSGGQGLTLSYWLKRLPDGSASPKLILEIDWRDSEGKYISPSRATINAGTLTTSWVCYSLTASAPSNATGAMVRLRVRGNGGFMLDAAQLRDSSETIGEFVRSDVWQSVHRASATAGLTAGEQLSNSLYGDIDEEIEEPLIRTATDAVALAVATFKARCLPLQRPTIEVVGYAESWRPGQWVRAVGEDAATVLPSPLPIVEIDGTFEAGILKHTLTPGSAPDTRQRLLQRLLEGVRSNSASSGSASAPSSGTALSYAAGATATALQKDANLGDVASVATSLTNLGLARGNNLLPITALNGRIVAYRTSSGQWVASGVAELLDTGLTLTPAAVGDTPLTLQGIANQTTPLLRTRSGLNQLPIWQHQNSLGAVRAYLKEGTNAPFFCTGPDVTNMSLGSFGYRLATAGGDADAEFYGNFGGFAGIGTIGAKAFLISTNSTQRIDVRPPSFDATFPRSHTGFHTLFMTNSYTYTGAAGTVPLSSGVGIQQMTLASTNAITVPILSSLLIASPALAGTNVTATRRASAAFGTGSNISNALALYRFSAAQTADIAVFLDETFGVLSRIDNVGAFRGPHKSADGSSGVTITEAGVIYKDGLRTAGALSITDTDLGTRTVDDTLVPTGNTSSLTTLLSCLAFMVKAITGGATWFAAVPETLTSLKNRVDALLARTISAGTGLTGGGNLSASRTLSLANTAVTPGTYALWKEGPTITIDAQGRITQFSVTSGVSDAPVTVFDSNTGALLNGSELVYITPSNYVLGLNEERYGTITIRNSGASSITVSATGSYSLNGGTVTLAAGASGRFSYVGGVGAGAFYRVN